MYYIYKIQNLDNNKKYIGLTNNIQRRRLRHFGDLARNCHDNSFLQKQYNLYGKNKFSFEVLYEGDVTSEEIGEKEREFIAYYDSYKNGYNQNEGGNFGPSNGGSHLIQTDILNICAALEFSSRPGGVLSRMYDVSLTTISRIKKKVNHCEAIQKYQQMPIELRKALFEEFCAATKFDQQRDKSTALQSQRQLTKQQVFMIYYNNEYNLTSKTALAKNFNLKSRYTLDCVIDGTTYKDYATEYKKLSDADKQRIRQLISGLKSKPKQKLKKQEVFNILQGYDKGKSQEEIEKQYDISSEVFNKLISGRTYKSWYDSYQKFKNSVAAQ